MRNRLFPVFISTFLCTMFLTQIAYGGFRIDLSSAVFTWVDLPSSSSSWDGSVTINLYSGASSSPVATQNFPWGSWIAYWDGAAVFPVDKDQEVNVRVEFTNTSALTKADELFLEIVMDGSVVGARIKVPQRAWAMFAKEALKADDADTVGGVSAASLEESAEIDADILAHAANSSAHHIKTTSFSDLTDSAADAQIPNDITVDHAADATTLAGMASSAFASASHNHNELYYTKTYVDALEAALIARIAALEAKLLKVTADANNIYITGANLHVISAGGVSGTLDSAEVNTGKVIIRGN